MHKEINLLDITIILLKHKKRIIIGFLLATVIAFSTAILWPKTYLAYVTFIPKGTSSNSFLSLMSGGAGDVLDIDDFTKRELMSLLYSRTLREELITTLNLIEYYENDNMPNPLDFTLKQLGKTVITITEEEEGGLGITNVVSVTIDAVDKDAEMAAKIANTLFEIFERRSVEFLTSSISNNVDYLKQKVDETTERFDSITTVLTDFQLKNKIYSLPEQLELSIKQYGEITSQLMLVDIELGVMSSTVQRNHPNLKSLKDRKKLLQQKLNKIEKQNGGDVIVGLNNSLNISETYANMVIFKETMLQLNSILIQQLEVAKIKMGKNYSTVILVDPARTPEWKHKPKRALIVIFIVGLYWFFMIPAILVVEYSKKMRIDNPKMAEKIDEITSSLFKFK